MKRITADGATGDNHFTDGDSITGVLPTELDSDFMNILQEEVCGVIEGAGLSVDQSHFYSGIPANNTGQLLAAIRALIGGNGFASKVFGDSPLQQVLTSLNVEWDTSGGNVTDKLPLLSTVLGQIVTVVKKTADANTITVQPHPTDVTGGKQISGQATQVISTQYTALRFLATPTQWVLVG